MTDSQSIMTTQNPKRRFTAMEIKKQQKQRKSLGFSLSLTTNTYSSQQTNKDEDDGGQQDELIKEKTIFNESSGKTVKEILAKNNQHSNDDLRGDGMMQGENSNSMKMFNSQFNNFFQEYQNNTNILELNRRQSSQQTQKKDQKQQIIDSKDNFQLVNEISLISGVNFEWFQDMFSSNGVISGYDTTKLNKESIQLIKQQIRKTLQTFKYVKLQSIQSDFSSQFNKEKSILKNQEIFITMRDCYQNFLNNRSNYFYYLTSSFTILFIHLQNNNDNSLNKPDKDRIVAVVWAKTLKGFDKFLDKAGINQILQIIQSKYFIKNVEQGDKQSQNFKYFKY